MAMNCIQISLHLYVFAIMASIGSNRLIRQTLFTNAESTEAVVTTTVVPQTFEVEPKDITVKEKEIAILPCVIKNKVGNVSWTKDKFGLGEERKLAAGFSRYKIIGGNDTNNYTLMIDPVLLEDEAEEGTGPGEYQCQVGAGKNGSPSEIRSKTAKLTVTVAPEPPVILNGGLLKTVEGPEVEIKCSSRGGKPAAEIKWYDSDDKEITKGVTTETEPYENTKRETLISTLKFKPGKSDHNTTRLCKATHDEISMNTSIHLLVEYSPDITLKMTSESTPILEGQNLIFNCTASANPPEVSYRWFVEGEIVPEIHGSQYIIPGVGRKLNSKSVKCEVQNVIGSNEKSEKLNIHYGPVFEKQPKDFSGKKGDKAKMTCKVDGNPKPKYIWFRNGHDEIVHNYDGSKSELTIEISESTVGKYICRALVEGFPEVEGSAEVLMKGAPHFLDPKELQYGQEGTDIKITCNAFSIPPPDKMLWNITSTGKTVDSKEDPYGKYVVIDEKRKDGVLSTLIVNNALHPTDFDTYTCYVENALGKDELNIKLKRERSLPLIIILSAVIGGILLTVLTILVMILGRRSTAQSLRVVNGLQPPEEEEFEGSTDDITASSSSSTEDTIERMDELKNDKSYGLDLDDPLLRSSMPTSVPPSIIDVYDELLGNKDLEYLEDPLDDNYDALSNVRNANNRSINRSTQFKRNQLPVPPPRKYKIKGGRRLNPTRHKTDIIKRPSRNSSLNYDAYKYSVDNDDLFSVGNNIYSDPSISHI